MLSPVGQMLPNAQYPKYFQCPLLLCKLPISHLTAHTSRRASIDFLLGVAVDPASVTGSVVEVELGVELGVEFTVGLGLGLGLDDFRYGTAVLCCPACNIAGRPITPFGALNCRPVGMLDVGKSPCVATGISPLACERFTMF